MSKKDVAKEEIVEETTDAVVEEKAEEIVEEKPAKGSSKKKYVVLDSNGKEVRVVDDEEKALELVRIYGGRLAK